MSVGSEHNVSTDTSLRADDVHTQVRVLNIADLEQAVTVAGREEKRLRYALTSATTVSPRVARKWVRQMQRPGETMHRTAEIINVSSGMV